MTTTLELWQPGTYAVADLRKMDSALLMSDGTAIGSRPGIRPGDPGFAVTLAGTTVNVSGGTAALYRSGQGVYRGQLAATSPGTLAAANATYARIDLVYLRAWDTDVDASGLRQLNTVLLTGTPSASPVAPSPGATEIYIPLATINVPNTGGGGTGSATVSSAVRQQTVAPGGILPVSSAADIALAGAYTGQTRYNTVRGTLESWTGTAWVTPGDWTSYTATWTASGTAPSIGNGTLTGRYTLTGRTCEYNIVLTAGSTTTFGSGLYSWGLPFTPVTRAGATWPGTALGINVGTAVYPGGTGYVVSGSAGVSVYSPIGAGGSANSQWAATVPFTWNTTSNLSIQGRYELP